MAKITLKKSGNPGAAPQGYAHIYVDENNGKIYLVDENNNTIPASSEVEFTQALKDKLDGIEENANNYSILVDLVNDLTTGGTNKALTAEQGKVLKQAIDNINAILSSSDTNLNELQEIVDYIKQNRSDLQNLSIDNIAGLQDALNNKANNVHTHTSSDITDLNNAINNNGNVAANTAARHTHNNKSLLDNIVDNGDGNKFLANDGTYKYAKVCGEANKIVFPRLTTPQYTENSDSCVLYYNGENINVGIGNKTIKLGKLRPYIGALSRVNIPINNITTVNLLGGNLDPDTEITYTSDCGAEVVGYNVVSSEEIQVQIQTYGQEGSIQLFVSNGGFDHFGIDINITIVAKKELDTINNLFVSHAGNIQALISSQYSFSGGDSGTNISDGGGDMYDGGNSIYTNLGGPLNYTNGTVTSTTILGGSGKYFTKKANYIFFAAFDLDNVSWIKTDGNNGADGSGSYHHGNFVQSGYKVYWKTVGDAGDPSINHIWILKDNSYTTQVVGSSTDSDLDKIANLDQAGVERIYYMLYAKSSGQQSPLSEIQSIANYLINNVI